MKRRNLLLLVIAIFLFSSNVLAQTNQKVYDFAKLLTPEQLSEVEANASHFSDQNQVDIIILTTDNTNGKDVVEYMQDFYDEMGLGYNKSHGDTVILTIDLQHREVYVAGFYKGMEYIDDYRANIIRETITPELSDRNYVQAFNTYIEQANQFLTSKPEHRPNDQSYSEIRTPHAVQKQENILTNTLFQLLISLILAGVIVGIMLYNAGGRKTTNSRTYLDEGNSKVTARRDQFVRTVVTKTKKPSSRSGGGGGGGMTGGGHSHSGSRGKF